MRRPQPWAHGCDERHNLLLNVALRIVQSSAVPWSEICYRPGQRTRGLPMSLYPLALELLDPTQSHALQTWEIADRTVIQIGRSADNDIVIASPVVSRVHAYVREIEGERELCVVSQNGVYVEGRRVESVLLREGLVFRLAAKGPSLRVGASGSGDDESRATIALESVETPLLVLDAAERDRRVSEIVDSDYFHTLKQTAGELRRRHKPTREPSSGSRAD